MKKVLEKFNLSIKKVFNKLKKHFLNLGFKLQTFFAIIKQKLRNNKKYIVIIILFGIFNFVLVSLFISFAYYQDLDSFSIINGVVGNINSNRYDSSFKIYLEDTDIYGNGNRNYYLAKEIPTEGYNYSGYECENNASLIFDETSNLVSIFTDEIDHCSIYFDIAGNRDLIVKIMLEDDLNSNTFSLGENIPYYGYLYSHYECANNSLLEYNSTKHTIKVSSKQNEYCTVYFKKIPSDIQLNLYVEENINQKDYIERIDIPTGKTFSLNEQKSECKNINDERIDTTINYIDGYIDINLNEYAYCNIYLDIYE